MLSSIGFSLISSRAIEHTKGPRLPANGAHHNALPVQLAGGKGKVDQVPKERTRRAER